MVSILKLGELA